MVLVFDLGATKLRMALVENGQPGEIHRLPTDRSAAGFAKFLGALEELVAGRKLSAVVGGVPGQLRGDSGVLALATNLPEWLGLEVSGRIHELFDCDVNISNDVELGGLGEARVGAGSVTGVMAYYTVSTGVNAVRLVEGNVDQTVGWYELGKQVVGHENGQPQSLEPLIGGAALEKRLGAAPHDIKDRSVWSEIDHYLAVGLFNTSLFWNPALIVLGGSMMVDIKLERVQAEMDRMPDVLSMRPKLALARLGDEAGIRGAAALATQLGYK